MLLSNCNNPKLNEEEDVEQKCAFGWDWIDLVGLSLLLVCDAVDFSIDPMYLKQPKARRGKEKGTLVCDAVAFSLVGGLCDAFVFSAWAKWAPTQAQFSPSCFVNVLVDLLFWEIMVLSCKVCMPRGLPDCKIMVVSDLQFSAFPQFFEGGHNCEGNVFWDLLYFSIEESKKKRVLGLF